MISRAATSVFALALGLGATIEPTVAEAFNSGHEEPVIADWHEGDVRNPLIVPPSVIPRSPPIADSGAPFRRVRRAHAWPLHSGISPATAAKRRHKHLSPPRRYHQRK